LASGASLFDFPSALMLSKFFLLIKLAKFPMAFFATLKMLLALAVMLFGVLAAS